MKTYELFAGEDLRIAELIQQRRLQMLVHSCLYYEMNITKIDDATWDKWARELRALQEQYPDIAKQVIWSDAFKDWDASTGAFLPLKDEWVMRKARWFTKNLTRPVQPTSVESIKPVKKKIRGKLF